MINVAKVNTKENYQTSLFDEIIVDNFAGGGGASTGIELATGKPVAYAINHDPAAILMHKTNHPYTQHLCESVWDVDPLKLCAGRSVGLAWFSPDCKHFSKAKGAALVSKGIRGLAWVVLRWAGTVRPRVIILENVEEFQTWGPVRKGKPVKSKSGQTYRKWRTQLESLGYHIESKVLCAADYGAPTTRKRFYLVARCDGKPIRWPEPTHSESGTDGKLKWRSAAEIIDWSVPAYSIFATKQEIKEKYGATVVRPLAENTLRRVIRGVDKFTIKCKTPFVLECSDNKDGKRFSPVTFSNTTGSIGFPAEKPVHTITTDGKQVLASAQLIQYHTEQTENVRANGVREPLPVVDASNRYGMVTAQLTEWYGNSSGEVDLEKPLRTVTSKDREALTLVHIQKYFGGEYLGCGDPADKPLSTVTALARHGICAAHVAEFKGSDKGQKADHPLRTITAGDGQFGVVTTILSADVNLGHWPKIRELLNRFCGYGLKEDEVILLKIGGIDYYIRDILLRMLTPKELYGAMGFPEDYIIENDYLGNPYPRAAQVARCGNAVCPQMAAAIVRANLPEYARTDILTMKQLENEVAV